MHSSSHPKTGSSSSTSDADANADLPTPVPGLKAKPSPTREAFEPGLLPAPIPVHDAQSTGETSSASAAVSFTPVIAANAESSHLPVPDRGLVAEPSSVTPDTSSPAPADSVPFLGSASGVEDARPPTSVSSHELHIADPPVEPPPAPSPAAFTASDAHIPTKRHEAEQLRKQVDTLSALPAVALPVEHAPGHDADSLSTTVQTSAPASAVTCSTPEINAPGHVPSGDTDPPDPLPGAATLHSVDAPMTSARAPGPVSGNEAHLSSTRSSLAGRDPGCEPSATAPVPACDWGDDADRVRSSGTASQAKLSRTPGPATLAAGDAAEPLSTTAAASAPVPSSAGAPDIPVDETKSARPLARATPSVLPDGDHANGSGPVEESSKQAQETEAGCFSKFLKILVKVAKFIGGVLALLVACKKAFDCSGDLVGELAS
ncbi:hypothetical protein AURDEDRAFT_152094 [Auricularia subglabra TFB-10046 SS5]|uniref:Uncharacterized protein n=1 Tax=Auricularia subglabra (strain TFB-10046 / SS5) TaxID=717982 RepID=J0WZ31_AURST|nr:hypothetical protein AURDEDRAFT_152094 [Auricularia subglabra TFB-10046 SS5]